MPPDVDDPAWRASAEAERAALIAALDGRRVAPGPAGAPARGRRDVLPTGRNLFTADPRTLPTPTAMELGRLAADEVVRAHLQTHGDMPRAVVIDLWGSATLRTGGEEIAQGLALHGLPADLGARQRPRHRRRSAADGRRRAAPRVDVTWRISGLFRDLFPAQIALIDAAVQAVAARDEADDENPLAAARRAARAQRGSIASSAPRRAPMAPASRICSAATPTPTRSARPISPPRRMPMAAPTARPDAAPGAFAQRVASADMLVHTSDDPGARSCSKAPRMPPSSAASPRRRKCSAARPISSCST